MKGLEPRAAIGAARGREDRTAIRGATGYLRLVHPYPSILDAVVTGLLATVAGGSPAVAGRLSLSMLVIQFGIGALNDVADADRDLARNDKPIAAALVTPRAATGLATAGFALGLVLAVTVSPSAFVVALAGITVGIAYDLRLKGTAWSWLGFALGLPLLPVFAWVGATGGVPGPIFVAAATAVPAGFALAIANALPDVERDREAGIESIVIALGVARAWQLAALAEAVLALGAVGSFVALGGGLSPSALPALVGMTGGLIVAGTGLAFGRIDGRDLRQRGWELQTIGIAIVAAAWAAGLAMAGRL